MFVPQTISETRLKAVWEKLSEGSHRYQATKVVYEQLADGQADTAYLTKHTGEDRDNLAHGERREITKKLVT